MSRHFRLVLTAGLGLTALGFGAACSKSNPDQSTSTTTNGESVTTTPSSSAAPPPATPGAPGAPGAQAAPGQRGAGRRQVFLDGCNGKNASDACTVQLGQRTLTGNCTALQNGPNQGQLSCRPSPGQFGPHHPGMDNQVSPANLRPGDPGYTPPPAHPPAAN